MSDLRIAAQQALEALESVLCDPDGKCCIDGSDADRAVVDKALTALRAALAQEQAEPVAWLQPKNVDGYSRPDLGYETCSKDDYGAFPVYRALAQEQADLDWQAGWTLDERAPNRFVTLARAAIAKATGEQP